MNPRNRQALLLKAEHLQRLYCDWMNIESILAESMGHDRRVTANLRLIDIRRGFVC